MNAFVILLVIGVVIVVGFYISGVISDYNNCSNNLFREREETSTLTKQKADLTRQRDGWIKEYQEAIHNLDATKAELETKKEAIKNQDRAIKASNLEVDRLRKLVESKDSIIDSNRKNLEKNRQTIDAQARVINNKTSAINGLSKEIDRLRDQIDSSSETLDGYIKAFDCESAEYESKINELEYKLSQKPKVEYRTKYLPLFKIINKIFYEDEVLCSGAKRMQRTPNIGRGYNILSVPDYNVKSYQAKAFTPVGYIYVAYSEFTGCSKIGYTAREVQHRISELNGVSLSCSGWQSTGAGTTFDWKYKYLIECSKSREDEDVHAYIKENRPNTYQLQQGEMFKMSAEDSLNAVLEYFAETYVWDN